MRALLLVVVVALMGAAGASARDLSPHVLAPDARCLAAAQAAGELAGIPKGLMQRLALVESGRLMPADGSWRPWPWSIDADGVDHFFDTQAQAVAWAEAAPAHGVRFLDAGCLQINLQYHPHAFASLTAAFDPWDNAWYAAQFLRSLYEQSGHDWPVAVGWYHSQTPELAEEYRDRVASLGEGIIAGLPRATLAVRLRLVGLVRLPLAGGGVLRLQLNRQPSQRPQAHRSACEVAAALAPLMASPPKLTGCLLHTAK